MKKSHPQTGDTNVEKGKELFEEGISKGTKKVEPGEFLKKKTTQLSRSKHTSMEDLGLDQMLPE